MPAISSSPYKHSQAEPGLSSGTCEAVALAAGAVLAGLLRPRRPPVEARPPTWAVGDATDTEPRERGSAVVLADPRLTVAATTDMVRA
jgi:hypothetical protein